MATSEPSKVVFPSHRDLFYGGEWCQPSSGNYTEVSSPGTGESLGRVAQGGVLDADRAVAAAQKGFTVWRGVAPLERAKTLRRVGEILREHACELAMIDAADCGNPVKDMINDAMIAAAQLDFFAGLVTEMKGASIPMGPSAINFSVREPVGVVARIVPFNHPFMFVAGKAAAPLAAGNAVIMKPPEQAPLSSLRLAELVGGLFPAGVFNVLPGGAEVGAALAAHPDVAMIALIGSVPTGRAVMNSAARTIKPVLLELGGKNALIAFADAKPTEVAKAAVDGMNFAWCGQSCGSTSRAFIHEKIYDGVVEEIKKPLAYFRPGIPTDPATTMGAIITKRQYDRVISYIESAKREGARLVAGGGPPSDPTLKAGLFIEPTVFSDVSSSMRVAQEEIFGPVLAIIKWSDETSMLREVNAVEYGLTCSIWTNDLDAAHRTAAGVQAGYVWVNEVSRHFLGAPFGGYKQSGIGREECLEELISFTREKNIHIRLR